MTVKDFIGTKAKYDRDGQMIFGVDNNERLQLILDVRAWGAIQNLFMRKDRSIDFEKAEKFQDELGEWFVCAINEKLERERK